MKKLIYFFKDSIIDRLSIDLGVFLVFFLVTVLFVFTIVRFF
jgi:hypothetical protein